MQRKKNSRSRHASRRARGKTPLSKGLRKNWLVWLVLAIIVSYSIWYCAAYAGGPSFQGDDNAYAGLAYQITQGTFRESSYIFTVRPLQVYPIAFSFWAFGINMQSSVAWDCLAFVGTVIITFLIGKELYDDRVGLLAALLMAFFPLVGILSVSMSDNIPMMFISALAFMSLICAMRRDSKLWYFLAGIFTVAAPLTTPESFITVFAILLLLIVELARRKITISRTTLYFVYGLVAAGLVLMLFNYLSSGNPVITYTVNSSYFSVVGQPNTIPAADQSLSFYPSFMFPFDLAGMFSRFGFNVIAALNSIDLYNYNQVGFYFYAVVLAIVYLIARRERRAYIPLFWFLFAFLYLEFGPMHVGFSPFTYVLSHKVGRFLCLAAVPLVLLVSMAAVRSSEKGLPWKRYSAIAVWTAIVLLMLVTGFMVAQFWHDILMTQIYDQVSIANYLNALPSNTVIYYTGTFSNVLLYMRFNNLGRFRAYDSIRNCSLIPGNTYIIVPKAMNIPGLDWTPDPSQFCPQWRLVLNPDTPNQQNQAIIGAAHYDQGWLYYNP